MRPTRAARTARRAARSARSGNARLPERMPAVRLPRASRARTCERAMIHDVDESLRALVRRDALNGSGGRGRLRRARPRTGWRAATRPSVDLYLYDIREDLDAARDRLGGRARRGRAGRRPPAAAAPLPALVPRDGLDPAAGGRAPPAVVAARLLPRSHEYMPGGAAGRVRSRARRLPVLLDRGTAASRRPHDRRHLVGARRRAQAVAGPGRHGADEHRAQPPVGPPVLEEPRLTCRAVANRQLPTGSAPARRKRLRPTKRSSNCLPRSRRSKPRRGYRTRSPRPARADQPGRRIRVRQIKRR